MSVILDCVLMSNFICVRPFMQYRETERLECQFQCSAYNSFPDQFKLHLLSLFFFFIHYETQ